MGESRRSSPVRRGGVTFVFLLFQQFVCKELLDKHGTILHIESDEGKGSRFWFEPGM